MTETKPGCDSSKCSAAMIRHPADKRLEWEKHLSGISSASELDANDSGIFPRTASGRGTNDFGPKTRFATPPPISTHLNLAARGRRLRFAVCGCGPPHCRDIACETRAPGGPDGQITKRPG